MLLHSHLLSCLLLIQSFGISFSGAQDLTGIWRGHFRSNDELERLATVNYDDRYKMEVQIAQNHNRFEAVTYSYKSTEFYGKADATGSLNPQSKKVILKETRLLEVRTAGGDVCIMTCFMQYSKLGEDEFLQGTYYSTNTRDSLAGCGKGSIFLHRVVTTDFHKEPFLEKKEKEMLARKKEAAPVEKSATITLSAPAIKKLETAKKTSSNPPAVKKQPARVTKTQTGNIPNKSSTTAPVTSMARDTALKISEPVFVPADNIPSVIHDRKNELLKTITVNHTLIELRIYDDGAIDNDTVSVYYDNILLISHARLSDLPLKVYIQVEPSGHPHKLVMVADNLGEIPPNTSLLVVSDGEKKYEERIISTEQKNIVINFVYKKIE